MYTIFTKTSPLSFALLAVTVAACVVPSATTRAGIILNVDSSAKEFFFTGSATGSPTSNHAAWAAGDALIDVYMSDFGPNKINAVKTVRSRSGLGLKESSDLVDNSPGIIFFDRTLLQATDDLSAMRAVGATVSPRIATLLGATSFSFAGIDGTAMTLRLADDALMIDLADAITAAVVSNSSPTTSYASASPAQQAYLESLVDTTLPLFDGAGFGSLEIENAVLVPEPTSLALLGVGAVGALARRRRSHNPDVVARITK